MLSTIATDEHQTDSINEKITTPISRVDSLSKNYHIDNNNNNHHLVHYHIGSNNYAPSPSSLLKTGYSIIIMY
jgi:hypothetical protein